MITNIILMPISTVPVQGTESFENNPLVPANPERPCRVVRLERKIGKVFLPFFSTSLQKIKVGLDKLVESYFFFVCLFAKEDNY
jgi:hypothetical protein